MDTSIAEQLHSHETLPKTPGLLRVGEQAIDSAIIGQELNNPNQAMQETAHRSFQDRMRFSQLSPAEAKDCRLRTRRELVEPLVASYHAASNTNQTITAFLDTIAVGDQQLRTYCGRMLNFGLSLDRAKAFMQQEKIHYQEPTDTQVAEGIDLLINNQPYHFDFRRDQKTYSLPLDAAQHQVITRIPLPPVEVCAPARYLGSPALLSKKHARHLRTSLTTGITTIPKPAPQQHKPNTKVQNEQQPTSTPVPLSPTSLLLENAIIARLPGNATVTTTSINEPPYEFSRDARSHRGETYASRIIDEAVGDAPIDNYKLTAQQVAEKISASINKESDTADVIELKQLAANICNGNGLTNKECIELIDTLGGHYGLRMSELQDFVVHMYEWSHPDGKGLRDYLWGFASLVNGFRMEPSAAKLLRAAGYTVVYGNRKDDAEGIDLFVDGIPFDIKASQAGAERHSRRIAKTQSRTMHPIKLIPPFSSADFAGELIIPDKSVQKILAKDDFTDMVDDAIAQYIKLHPETYQHNDLQLQ